MLLMLMTAVFNPWAFYLGGRLHILAYWQGWGRLHSNAAGGDYAVLVRIGPSYRKHSGLVPTTSLAGMGYVCTPRGEIFRMNLGGGMRPHLNTSTDGEAINLYMHYWPALYGSFITAHRPSIEFRGHWRNPNLVMDDHGSISSAFQPDGSVYQGRDPNRPHSREVVPITLKEGSYAEFASACKSIRP